MPRYYCDYCDTYLTHDSPSVRKQHNAGYKHKSNVRTYYQQFEEQQSQSLLEQKIKEYQGQNQFQVGATFNQFLQQRPRLPVLPLPILPVGSLFVSGVRPPILPPPVSGVTTVSGYGASSSVSMAPPGVMPMQMNNMPRPPMLNLPSPAVSSTMANGATSYQAIPSFSSTASPGASNTLEGFAYSQNAGSNH